MTVVTNFEGGDDRVETYDSACSGVILSPSTHDHNGSAPCHSHVLSTGHGKVGVNIGGDAQKIDRDFDVDMGGKL